MKTTEVTQEQISAFADGELDDPYIDEALALLRRPGGKADWAIYHQIGDVLRSDDMDVKMRPDFSARFAARLEQEPTYIAPAATNATIKPAPTESCSAQSVASSGRLAKRWAFSGIAASIVAAVAFVTTPQLLVALKPASSESQVDRISVATTETSVSNSAPAKTGVVAANAPAGVVMRDSRIDDYLFAHQRFSPSVYSTTQYARPATFPTESSK